MANLPGKQHTPRQVLMGRTGIENAADGTCLDNKAGIGTMHPQTTLSSEKHLAMWQGVKWYLLEASHGP